MNKERQIVEMAKVIVKADDTCLLQTISEALYKAGYRKQSENTVEVVKCKNCKHWNMLTEKHWGECREPLGDYRYCETAENDFCSYGEMKGGE